MLKATIKTTNSVAGDSRYSLNNRFGIVAHHINDRLKKLENSSTSNLQLYIRKFRKKAIEKIKKDPQC